MVLLVAQFLPQSQSFLSAAPTLQSELSVDIPNGIVVGETFKLVMEKNQFETTASTIQLSSNAKIDLDNIENTSLAEVLYSVETNRLTIEWAKEVETAVIKVDVLVVDEGDIKISSSNYAGEEVLLSSSVQLTADPPSEEPEELVEEDEVLHSDIESEEESPTEIEEPLEVGAEETEVFEEEEKEEELASNEADSEDVESLTETEELPMPEVQESEPNDEEVGSVAMEVTAKETGAMNLVAANRVGVSSWDSFAAELRNPQVDEIQVLANLNAPIQSSQQFVVNSNKKIIGLGNRIDFRNHMIRVVGQSNLTVENLKIRAEQSVLHPDPSVFYSNDANAVLHLQDTSFDGVQSAQVASLMNGHVRVSGTVNFQTREAFEVFEAKNITFEDNSSFVGSSTGSIAVTRKELLNLYNSPKVTIGKNANVRLVTNSRHSLIASKDGSIATITISERGKLEVIAETLNTTSGNPLIHLPGTGSTISFPQTATLDIQNHREGSTLGGLLNMNGLFTINGRNKVAFWDKGANVNLPSGNDYRYFSHVIDGRLLLANNRIITGNANERSSRSISDNPGKNGRTFAETFMNRDTNEMKRLLITPPEAPTKPIINPMTDQDTLISGKAIPGMTIKVIDKLNNETWQTTANATTGTFSVALNKYAPYKAGTVLYAVAIDAYGAESEEASTVITGAALTLSVPPTLPFQVTPITFGEVMVPRQNPNWSMKVKDTRGQGSRWRIKAKMVTPLATESGEMLPSEVLVFKKGQQEQLLLDGVLIEEGTTGNEEETTIRWSEEEGIFVKINPIKAGVRPNKTYSTTIQWTIENAP